MSDEPSSTAIADPPPRPPSPAGSGTTTAGDRIRFLLRGIGQTLITAGLVILLFVVYEVYVTNVFAHRQQVKVHQALEKEWEGGKDPLVLPGGASSTIPIGDGIANIYIPRFGRDFAFTIVEGTDDASLEKGPGHYQGTALPAGVGNFAVAGHRVGKGEPFLNLDRLKTGDTVIIETRTSWYVYVVKGARANIDALGADGVAGREIVSPSDGNVLLPVPNHPSTPPTERLMTMTTCHPKFTATQRLVVHALLNPRLTAARAGTSMPASISALYAKAGS